MKWRQKERLKGKGKRRGLKMKGKERRKKRGKKKDRYSLKEINIMTKKEKELEQK